jgi:hypothetical protein
MMDYDMVMLVVMLVLFNKCVGGICVEIFGFTKKLIGAAAGAFVGDLVKVNGSEETDPEGTSLVKVNPIKVDLARTDLTKVSPVGAALAKVSFTKVGFTKVESMGTDLKVGWVKGLMLMLCSGFFAVKDLIRRIKNCKMVLVVSVGAGGFIVLGLIKILLGSM